MLRGLFADGFDDLLAAWREHDRLRGEADTPLLTLANSRLRLDDLRQSVNALRRSYAPEPGELESVLITTFCSAFEDIVFLYQSDADWSSGAARYRCACGQLVAAPSRQT